MAQQQNGQRGEDGYKTWRVSSDGMRLGFQHFVWREHLGYNLHPSIELPICETVSIADVAAGSCLWSLQVVEQLGPECRIEACDMTLHLAPPKSILPTNVQLRIWNFFDPVPEDFIEKFDTVHVRLIVAAFPNGRDPMPVLEKFASMLKPGGYLQWDEYTYSPTQSDMGFQYLADHTKFSSPQTSHPANVELYKNIIDGFHWDTEFFNSLPERFEAVGIENAIVEQKETNASIARAFFEYYIGGFVPQMIGIYDKIDPIRAREQRRLLKQVYRDWEEDGVIAVPLPRIVVGRKQLK